MVIMKTKKILRVFLSMLLSTTIGSNAYMFFIASKLSSCSNMFERIEVIGKYNLFDKMEMGTYSLILTIFTLMVFLGFTIKGFFSKS